MLFKFEARTLWQPSKHFPISFWLQTWGDCRAASKQRSTRAKEPTAFHFALCYVKHCQTISSQNVTDLHSSWSESAKQQSIHVAPSACFVPALLPDEAALYKSDKPATSSLPRSLAHIDFHQIASSLCKQPRRSQSPAEPVPNREPDPANKDPLRLKLSSSCTMVLQCLPWCTKIHWSKSTPNGFHHDSSCMYQRWWCTALASPSFKLHALWIVPTPRKKKTQLCLRCYYCWKSLKPFSSAMATDSSPSLLHDFSKTICIRCESFYSFVLFKFEARTLWQPSKHFPISFWQQTWGNCRAASKQRSTRAKEPTAFHFALCYVKHCQTISSQNVTDLHSSWSESAKQQSIHVAPSACFVPALLPDEAALYKSDKPATSSLPLSFAHIDFHQIASSLCRQPRRSQSPAEPVPNREPDPANKDPLRLKLC